MPPRVGKSESLSHYFLCWYLNLFPQNKVILSSYEASFAALWSKKVRNTILSNPDLLSVRLAPDSTAADSFMTTKGGGLHSAGANGSITGRGASLVVVDDPVKNFLEASSQTYQDRTYDWYRSTVLTRLEPEGSLILLQTRWHERDLAGRLMETGEFEVINFPAIAEEEDILGRQPGDSLWPDRFSVDQYLKIKESVGTYVWNSLYQQRPSSPEGLIIKAEWWQYYDFIGDLEEEVISVDCSFSGKETSDYVAMQCWGRRKAEFFLIDSIRGKWDFPQTKEQFKNFCNKYPRATKRLIEAKANGQALMDSLKQDITGLIAINPKESKIARVHAVAPMIESGNVKLPNNKSFVNEFIEEFTGFPTAKNDDMVDCTTQALTYMSKPRIVQKSQLPN